MHFYELSRITKAVENNIVAIPNLVIKTVCFLYLPTRPSNMRAMNGGAASCKLGIGSGKTRFEK